MKNLGTFLLLLFCVFVMTNASSAPAKKELEKKAHCRFTVGEVKGRTWRVKALQQMLSRFIYIYRVCSTFRITKLDDYFLVTFFNVVFSSK